MNRRENKGITLISLVVTIIILIILAGISINSILGDNGLFRQATKAKETYEEQAAREKLEIALIALQSYKYNNNDYNEDTYIDNYLANEGMIVIPDTDIVVVDNWNFQIDRTIPKILDSLGKGKENEKIKIEIKKTISTDYTKATINYTITYDEAINEIVVNGEKLEKIPEKEGNVYLITKDVTENKNYSIVVKDKDKNYKTKTIKVSELTENMKIGTAQELVEFQKKVNEGRTFEGKTVTIMNDIDLSTVCGENIGSWTPIGSGTNDKDLIFCGTFNGNNHRIYNLYGNYKDNNFVGLFGNVSRAKLNNITVEGEIISSSSTEELAGNCAGLVGCINQSTVSNCINKVNITCNNKDKTKYGGISGWARNNYFY